MPDRKQICFSVLVRKHGFKLLNYTWIKSSFDPLITVESSALLICYRDPEHNFNLPHVGFFSPISQNVSRNGTLQGLLTVGNKNALDFAFFIVFQLLPSRLYVIKHPIFPHSSSREIILQSFHLMEILHWWAITALIWGVLNPSL